MDTTMNVARSVWSLRTAPEALSDEELLNKTRLLVARSNQLLAELLAHLAEVETRGIHRIRACSSLYTYCIYELRLSEDAAFRRVAAARLVKRFPALLDTLSSGELHLTGLLLLGPHLTETNFVEVLARAKHRTKRELAALVRVLDPLSSVPARIEPLGPAPARQIPGAATWEAIAQALCPVRELAVGDRPRDWIEGANDGNIAATGDLASAALAADASTPQEIQSAAEEHHTEPLTALEPQRYGVQFTATEEYVRLVAEARALLSHTAPKATLAEIQLRALRTFVATLRKQKYGAAQTLSAPDAEPDASAGAAQVTCEPTEVDSNAAELPRRRGRHIPLAVRRSVFTRNDGRCSFTDSNGRRCAETHGLEFHHLKPFAVGGEHTLANLTLRCRAHNALAAESDFGRAFVEAKVNSVAHEPLCRQRGEE
jgi:hypothetical protein